MRPGTGKPSKVQVHPDRRARRRPFLDPASSPPRRPLRTGPDAAKLLVAMMAFGEAWYLDRGQEPIRLFDRETGRRVKAALVDAETGKPLDPRTLYPGPGPSFPRSEEIRRERFTEYYARPKGAPGRAPRG
jgi:hypothetical protein